MNASNPGLHFGRLSERKKQRFGNTLERSSNPLWSKWPRSRKREASRRMSKNSILVILVAVVVRVAV